ncbi:MAG: phytanoyl-CoA dioxygenase family protein [Polyangiaceae bacterium]|nr:phytanoyl-CoA dioxygenase family protein [Polyangiaceae bacterium]
MPTLSSTQLESFSRDGFAVLPGLFSPHWVNRVKERFGPLFAGEFETGVWPDEWYWREEISLPDATRHMSGAWKSDKTIAAVSLSAELGKVVSTLVDWPGARIGLDTLWWKTPGAKAIALHQDSTYHASLNPAEVVTCWVALDDTEKNAGTIEYVPGSHRWALKEDIGEFHAPKGDYQSTMRAAARAAGVIDPEVVQMEVAAGTCIIHHGRLWHGSGSNQSATRIRRSLAVHLTRSDTQFRSDRLGYVYGRYKRRGDLTMDESFFPITWTRDGYRTPWLSEYCEDACAP